MNNNLTLLYNLRRNYPKSRLIHPDISADWDIAETIELLHKGLEAIGFQVEDLSFTPEVINSLEKSRHMIFNICEMYGGSYREALVPALLEIFEIPYVFSQPDVMLKTLDKNLCNHLVKQIGVNVPEWHIITDINDLNFLVSLKLYPYIVKLSHEGSGIGISDNSVVHSYKELCSRVNYLIDNFQQPVIAQQYIEGIETTIGIAGDNSNPTIFKLVEVELLDSCVYGFIEKESAHSKARFHPFNHEKVESQVADMSKLIYARLNCRDAARIDLRLEKKTLKPYFIEINPLPHLHPELGDFCKSAQMAGFSYESLLDLIMKMAIKRYHLN